MKLILNTQIHEILKLKYIVKYRYIVKHRYREVDGRERRDTFARNSVSRGKYNVSRCNLDKICNY
uniref:Putative ovule protein n=1 Tax=Solanum chacoense TaxID=4108 RepID=A0A0V0HQN0_SOLCH